MKIISSLVSLSFAVAIATIAPLVALAGASGSGGATGIRTVISQDAENGCRVETHLLEILRLDKRLSSAFAGFMKPLLSEKDRSLLAQSTDCKPDGSITLNPTIELQNLIFDKSWLADESAKIAFELALKRIVDVAPGFAIERDRREFTPLHIRNRVYVNVDDQNSGPIVQDFGRIDLPKGSKAVQLIVRTGQYYQVMVPDYLTATALDVAAAWIHDLVYTDSTDTDALGTQQVVEYVFSEDYDHDSIEARKQRFSELGFRFRSIQGTAEVNRAFKDSVLVDFTDPSQGMGDEQMASFCEKNHLLYCPLYLETLNSCPVVEAYSNGVLNLKISRWIDNKHFGPMKFEKKITKKLNSKEQSWFEGNRKVLKVQYLPETLHSNYFPEAYVVERVCFKNGLREVINEIVENSHVKNNLAGRITTKLSEEESKDKSQMESEAKWNLCMARAYSEKEELRYRRFVNVCKAARSSDQYLSDMIRINKRAASFTMIPLRSDKIVRRITLLRTN